MTELPSFDSVREELAVVHDRLLMTNEDFSNAEAIRKAVEDLFLLEHELVGE